MYSYRFFLLVVAAMISACAYHPERQLPQIELAKLDVPKGSVLRATPETQWWQNYGSAELASLYDTLHKHNLDLAAAKYRVGQYRALLGQQSASNWPSLNVQLGSRHSQNLDTDAYQHSRSLNFSASYEVDLWSSRSAEAFSAELLVVARQQEFQSLLLQLQAALAQSFFEILSLQERIDIAKQNLQASAELLTLIQHRFEAGSASGVEVNQQRNTWLATRVQVLELERNLVNKKRALAVLLGEESSINMKFQTQFSDLTLPSVSLIQPASLLEYRPDIQLAETQWRLSEASLYQEQQKRWPKLSISAGLSLNDLFSSGESWLADIAASLGAPLFDAGRIRNQIDAAELSLGIAELHYKKAVILAMQDTLEALDEFAYQEMLFAVREQELDNNAKLYDLAKLRYDSGDTDFINLLSAQRSWFSARDSMIQSKTNHLLTTVNVFRAMGIAPITENESPAKGNYPL